jgi:MFS family permease
LFGSIIMYSLANLACGFVQTVNQYALLRFIAGIGLSGEIGAAIVLVSEILPKNIRSFGSSLVAGVGYLGAGLAYATQALFDWRTAFFVGGGMGLVLLLLRVSVFESGLFVQMKQERQTVSRGNFLQFFSSWPNAVKYLRCVAVGLPTWFVVGILATFANEFGEALGIAEPVKPGQCVMMIYVGLAIGDLLSGPFSHWIHSRRRSVIYLLIGSLFGSGVFLFGGIQSATGLYTLCLFLGFCTGYVAMYLTMVAEQYGTNLRATATTSAPAVVRGMVIPMAFTYQALQREFSLNALVSASVVGLLVYALAFWSLANMEETIDKDLGFVEE